MEMSEGSAETEKPEKKLFWGFWATTGFGVTVIIASVIAQGLVALAFLVNYLLSHRGADFSAAMNYVDSTLGSIVSMALLLEVVIGIPLLAVFVRLRRTLSLKDYLGLHSFKIKTLLFWLAVNVVYLVTTEGLRYAFNIPQSQNDTTLYSTSTNLTLFFVSIVIFGPIFEEALFRGFMLTGYAASRIGPFPAIVITAAMWATLHLPVGAYDLLVIFTGGLVLGLARWKTGSLWVTLAMHAFWNIMAFITLAAAGPS